MLKATAKAGINIALVKYWGKRDRLQNLPAVSSLSLTLSHPGTVTSVVFDPALKEDQFFLNDRRIDDPKVWSLIEEVRAISGVRQFAKIESRNDVITGGGLASSASGFAALGCAAWVASGLSFSAGEMPSKDLIDLVRRGSGSAARSLLGGAVMLRREDGLIEQILPESEWDLRLVVAIFSKEAKKVSSRDGMARTKATSPYYEPFLLSSEKDIEDAKHAFSARDFDLLGKVTERSAMRMHAAMMASDPPLWYLSHQSWEAVEAIKALQEEGVSVYFTADAGPQVKALCQSKDLARVRDRFEKLPGVLEVLETGMGPGVQVALEHL